LGRGGEAGKEEGKKKTPYLRDFSRQKTALGERQRREMEGENKKKKKERHVMLFLRSYAHRKGAKKGKKKVNKGGRSPSAQSSETSDSWGWRATRRRRQGRREEKIAREGIGLVIDVDLIASRELHREERRERKAGQRNRDKKRSNLRSIALFDAKELFVRSDPSGRKGG